MLSQWKALYSAELNRIFPNGKLSIQAGLNRVFPNGKLSIQFRLNRIFPRLFIGEGFLDGLRFLENVKLSSGFMTGSK